jgi:hypothetical protein
MPDAETVWKAPKKKPEDDPVLDRMIKDMARHETQRLNKEEMRLTNRRDRARGALINMPNLDPADILALDEELEAVEQEQKELRASRKDVRRMRSQKAMALAKKALAEKRAQNEKKKRRKIINKMKGK